MSFALESALTCMLLPHPFPMLVLMLQILEQTEKYFCCPAAFLPRKHTALQPR